ncbi:MAG: MmgE/PrpD family protein [Acidobacteria bacterium]|nr:MmgE/PrpD family protein [Acidobacteriota bacterium]
MTNETRATAAVIDYVTQTSFDRFPREAVSLAKQCVIDGLGVILAGTAAPGTGIVRDYVRRGREAVEATVLGADPFSCRAASAALVNATAGHALDFDDTQLSSSPDRTFGLLTHPTIPPLVASLAVGERLGASGRQVLEAYLVGFEVACKMAEAINPTHYQNGFHTSGTFGTFGAMVSAARLLRLGADSLGHALAIASSMSSGIRLNFGTMTKPLHVGRAAQNGVMAAELAAAGHTGGKDALDGPWGFFRVFTLGAGFDANQIVGALGNPPSIVSPGVSLKPYPCGSLGHPTMDAMLKLVKTNDVNPEQVKAVRVRAGSNILNPLRYPFATTELEAKFCLPFMMSSLLLRRRAGIHEFTDEFVQSAPAQEMMRKVTTVRDAAIEARGFDKMRSIIEVDLTDGRTLVQEADERYRGGPDKPFTREELHGKFTDCASLVMRADVINAALDHLESLEQVRDIRELVTFLTAGVLEGEPTVL